METIKEIIPEEIIVKERRKYIRKKPLEIKVKEPKPPREKKPSSRLDPETGKYNNNPLDPNYFKTYFQEKTKGVSVECPHCHKLRKQIKNGKPHEDRHLF